jgi:hypothetical protein
MEGLPFFDLDRLDNLNDLPQPGSFLTFDGHDRIQLCCEEGSIVQIHGTLYALQRNYKTHKPDVKNRVSVMWRPVGATRPNDEKAIVFVRPTDWKPSLPRYCLRAEDQGVGGWRTYSVSAQHKHKPRKRTGSVDKDYSGELKFLKTCLQTVMTDLAELKDRLNQLENRTE